jgi:hypothetical protein
MDQTTMRRLAFIRYLYTLAVKQSMQPEPHGSASILTFHDSIELFLHLAYEHFNLGAGNDPSFMGYWDQLAPQLPPGGLPQREAMRRMNRSRVELKHHGILPSRLDMDAFRANVTSFFEDSCLMVFGIDFNSISLVNLIQYASVRTTLDKANKLIEAGKTENAIAKITIAFTQLLDEYESKTQTDFGRSLFSFDQSFSTTFSTPGDEAIADFASEIESFANEVESFANNVESALVDIQNAIKILALGLDYRRYVRFQLLTPSVVKLSKEDYEVRPKKSKVETLTIDHFRFCFDFVIESALELQAFDLEIKVVPAYLGSAYQRTMFE